MSFIKNTQIASEYRVSSTTVLNWIADGVAKKNNLIVELFGAKYKIIDNAHNHSVLINLANNAVIYRNKIEVKKTKVNPELYNFFTEDQLIELINKLEINRTVPLKFSYLGDGTKYWNEFVDISQKNGTYLASTIISGLLNKSLQFIIDRVASTKKVNIIDLGAGDSRSMVEITKYFNDKKMLNKYLGVDISEEMLDYSEKNILNLDPDIQYLKHVVDFEKQDLAKVFFDIKDSNTVNLVFFVEATFGNVENTYRTLENFKYSLGEEDLFIVTNRIDKIQSRSYFSINKDSTMPIWLTKSIGIDTELCDFITSYDDKTERRLGYFVLDKDYEIDILVENKLKTVRLFKNDRLTIWYHKMSEKNNIFNELDQAGLQLLDFTTTNDHSFFLAICQAVR